MKNTPCPFCEGKNSRLIFEAKGYNLVSCLSCGLGYISPMLSETEIRSFYDKDYFLNDQEGFCGYKDYEGMNKVLVLESQKKIKFIRKFTKGKKLLDVGAGLGSFLKIAKSQGFKVSGNDVSQYAKNQVKKELSIPFYKGAISEKILPSSQFEIVTAWDVFEHIPNVNEAFGAANKALVPGGYLFLTTPNINSWDAKVMGKFWYGYKKIPEHLVFFSQESIDRILTKNGFRVVKIQNWGFVRDFNFLASRISLYLPILGKFMAFVVNFSRLGNLSLFLPLTDMMVVAKKKNARED